MLPEPPGQNAGAPVQLPVGQPIVDRNPVLQKKIGGKVRLVDGSPSEHIDERRPLRNAVDPMAYSA
jgi:hypothetical protein